MRLFKFIIGLFLLPVCAMVLLGLLITLNGMRPEAWSRLPVSVWWLLGGFGLWVFMFYAMPKPVRTYVFAHELTHALWAWAMGARVSKIKVSRRGGSVAVSSKNFLITLAPYFCPLYTLLAMLLYYVLQAFFDLSTYEPFWMAVIGFTWGFHLTFTIYALAQHQPDVQEHGRVFSYAVIYLFNLLGIGLWVVIVASPTLETYVESLQTAVEMARAWVPAPTFWPFSLK